MVIIGGILMAALLVAVLTSIKAEDGPRWGSPGLHADRPASGSERVGTIGSG
jgi:hypothetical protein